MKENSGQMNGDQAQTADTLKKVLKAIGRYRFILIVSILLAGISVILQLYVPVLFGDAIDRIIAQGNVDFQMVLQYLWKIAVLVIAAALATYVMNLLNNKMTYAVVRDIRARAIRQIQVLPLSYLDAHSSGDIVSRVIADADQFSDGLLLGFTQLFTGVITIIATLGFMLSKNVWITILVVCTTPVSFFAAKFIASHSYTMFRAQNRTRGDQTALIEEMVGNAKVVKAFGHEEKASQQFRQVNEQLKEYSQKATFYSSLTNPSTRFVNNIIYAVVALTGTFAIFSNSLTVGGLSVMLNYSNQYMKPFNDISSVVTELQNALACAARLFALIEETPEKDAVDITKKEDASLIDANKESVDIEKVYFSYTRDKKLIEDYSLQARPGMHVAIVGPTGCGKTTMINLLMRFYDADAGDIKLDGTSIYSMDRHALRRNYGMVLQDTWLKNGTVRENINIGKPNATDEEIITAAKEAHSWEFIRRLPGKLDAVLNEDSLSQGQKQLLCITRVMLCLPPMLILDEATSSIDTRTEMLIQSAFDKLMEGRTSFIVAHRLSTIRNADVILVMKDGKIIEQGNHEQLMAANGFYTNLYNSQFALEQ
jgi:ATP-binding cassette subfamily B protein